jgi:integrase
VVRKRLADGTIKEYRYPRNGAPKDQAPRWAADSINALLQEYIRSLEFEKRAKVTQKYILHYLKPLYAIGHYKAADLRRRQILQIRDGVIRGSGTEAGNSFIKAGRGAFKWAISRDWFDSSPFDNIPRLEGGEFPAWTDEQAEAALNGLPEPLRRVVYLGAYTSQRRSDLVAMKWTQVAGGVLHLKQIKTGMEVTMPLHPVLAAEMEVWRAEATRRNGKDDAYVLTTAKGERWTGQGLSQAMKRALNKLGVHGINVHGLRKLAAKRLAEDGCTTHEIAAITGHKSLQQVQHYTDKADRARLASAAVARLKARS